ncbi:MAG: error-prone DNA polymerase, partial [Xanthomonadales bacterium]|nr:error-prone DNA polymerase [Xanthomonadales bacterium]
QLQSRRVRLNKLLLSLPHGTPVRACGLVILRQRPATAKGTLFLTLEDESGTLNVVCWPYLFEQQRAVLLHSRLIRVDGVLESDGAVQHLIARRLEDYSHMLDNLRTPSRDFC